MPINLVFDGNGFCRSLSAKKFSICKNNECCSVHYQSESSASDMTRLALAHLCSSACYGNIFGFESQYILDQCICTLNSKHQFSHTNLVSRCRGSCVLIASCFVDCLNSNLHVARLMLTFLICFSEPNNPN
jgi:hypothetical protein